MVNNQRSWFALTVPEVGSLPLPSEVMLVPADGSRVLLMTQAPRQTPTWAAVISLPMGVPLNGHDS